VRAALTDAATFGTRASLRNNGVWFVYGQHEGVTVCAVVRPDGRITAGWPIRGPGIRTNPG